jgi:hypothetical protein
LADSGLTAIATKRADPDLHMDKPKRASVFCGLSWLQFSRASALGRHAPRASETVEVLATWGSLADEGVRPTIVEQFLESRASAYSSYRQDEPNSAKLASWPDHEGLMRN